MMKDEPNQSSSSPRSSATSSAPRNVATSTKPTRSKPPACRRHSRRAAAAPAGSRRTIAIAAVANTPTGTLIRKHQRQETLSASHPPSVGPTTGATTTATPNRAKPWPRFSGGKASARIDCATGTMPPPAKPCRTRNSSIDWRLHATPHSHELIVNSTRQMRKKVLRPRRLARKLLAVRMMALATRYVVTTQDASSSLTPMPPAI